MCPVCNKIRCYSSSALTILVHVGSSQQSVQVYVCTHASLEAKTKTWLKGVSEGQGEVLHHGMGAQWRSERSGEVTTRPRADDERVHHECVGKKREGWENVR
jgi:hypothetical protein